MSRMRGPDDRVVAERRDDPRPVAPPEPPQGLDVEMVVMVVRDQHRVDRRQVLEGDARRVDPLGPGEGDRARPLREDRVGQEVEPRDLDQQRGMADRGRRAGPRPAAGGLSWKGLGNASGQPCARRRAASAAARQGPCPAAGRGRRSAGRRNGPRRRLDNRGCGSARRRPADGAESDGRQEQARRSGHGAPDVAGPSARFRARERSGARNSGARMQDRSGAAFLDSAALHPYRPRPQSVRASLMSRRPAPARPEVHARQRDAPSGAFGFGLGRQEHDGCRTDLAHRGRGQRDLPMVGTSRSRRIRSPSIAARWSASATGLPRQVQGGDRPFRDGPRRARRADFVPEQRIE